MKVKIIFSITMISLLNISCGTNTSSKNSNARPQASSYYFQYNDGNEVNSNSSGDQPSSSPAPSNNTPPLSLTVRKVGYDSPYTIQVPVRRTLKIKFTPGIPNETVQGSGFTAQYSQLGVFISVGTQEQSTPLLRNGLLGEQESSPVLDFSGSIPQTCPESDPACRVSVTITVRKPNYDYWCFNYGAYCSYTRVWETHPWNGELKVETDDTQSL